ncbi:unnamed protein product, partial [Polarella glacialis]
RSCTAVEDIQQLPLTAHNLAGPSLRFTPRHFSAVFSPCALHTSASGPRAQSPNFSRRMDRSMARWQLLVSCNTTSTTIATTTAIKHHVIIQQSHWQLSCSIFNENSS